MNPALKSKETEKAHVVLIRLDSGETFSVKFKKGTYNATSLMEPFDGRYVTPKELAEDYARKVMTHGYEHRTDVLNSYFPAYRIREIFTYVKQEDE